MKPKDYFDQEEDSLDQQEDYIDQEEDYLDQEEVESLIADICLEKGFDSCDGIFDII